MGRSERDIKLAALLSFLAGGILGAGVALLFAPQSGKRTRSQIKDFAEDIKDNAVEYAGKLKQKVF